MRSRSPSPIRVPAHRARLTPVLAGLLVATVACSSDQGIAVPSAPTLQAAATQVGGAAATVVAVAPTVATSAAQVGGTAAAAAAPAATSAANVAATAATAVAPVVTRVATTVAEARATADASTTLNNPTPVGGTPAPSPGATLTASPAASPVGGAPGR